MCGEKTVSAVPLIVNGKNVVRGNYPWVAAIYRLIDGEWTNACGGSMLTQRVILTGKLSSNMYVHTVLNLFYFLRHFT